MFGEPEHLPYSDGGTPFKEGFFLKSVKTKRIYVVTPSNYEEEDGVRIDDHFFWEEKLEDGFTIWGGSRATNKEFKELIEFLKNPPNLNAYKFITED
jgi:hypothetical protein